MLQLSADLGTDIEGTSTKRIGKENENGEQLILVSLTSELQAQNILKLAKTQGVRTLHKYLHQ